ncbi:lanthionine synthetase C family protein [Micromonospora robiginosa]|uniref:Lanthionine synthetase C family protein n=1 Tax=Micromonospora robiginosa TaxID=2749844 RepID=A0A7L6B3C1_9ACTN|nr:lanthionine synthetase C family protein [Micromonospora ferruginea]QLQ36472.1 lanthionine synthetase C family protein [Micromonospora ferruginea]
MTSTTRCRAREVASAAAEAIRTRTAPGGRLDRADDGDGGRSPGLASGHAGLALMAAALDESRPGAGWDRFGHLHLAASLGDEATLSRLGPSLHTGWGGLAVAATALAAGRPRYRAFLAQCDTALAHGATLLARQVRQGVAPLRPPLVDLVTGLAGVTVALLIRRGRSEIDAALREALAALVTLARPDDGSDGHPRLVAPPQWGAMRLDGRRPLLNLGVAHGLPGVLSALALASIEGVGGDATTAAVAGLTDWLRRYRRADRWGPAWPNGVSVDPTVPVPPPGRSAWCYGTAGCARALWLAGCALDRATWRAEAVDAVRGTLRRPPSERGITSPTFCHGQAGLAHIALRFAADTGDGDLATAAEDEVIRLIEVYEPDSVFGFRRRERDEPPVDSAGVLDGAAGVVLVLLAASGDGPAGWDRIFAVA